VSGQTQSDQSQSNLGQSSLSQSSPGQSSPGQPSQSQSDKTKSPKPSAKLGSKNSAATKKVSGSTTSSHKAKAGTGSTRSTTAKRRKRPLSPRVRRIRQAFVASTTLRPMAQQLLLDPSPAAYAGVEAFARAHAKEDAGALAWLVEGYAHVVDRDYAKAIDPLNRAKPKAGDLGGYVAYYLGPADLQTGHLAEALATLGNFDSAHPDSLLVRDAHVSYADALLLGGRATEAVALLEKD